MTDKTSQEKKLKEADAFIQQNKSATDTETREQSARQSHEKSIWLFQLGLQKEAFDTCAKLIETFKDEDNIKIKMAVSAAYMLKGVILNIWYDDKKALEAHNQAIEIVSGISNTKYPYTLSMAYWNKATTEINLHRSEDAIKTLKECIRLCNASNDIKTQCIVTDAYFLLGTTLERIDQYTEAFDAYAKVTERPEEYVSPEAKLTTSTALYKKGICLAKNTNYEDAIDTINEQVNKHNADTEIEWINMQYCIMKGTGVADIELLAQAYVALDMINDAKKSYNPSQIQQDKDSKQTPSQFSHYTTLEILRAILQLSDTSSDKTEQQNKPDCNFLRIGSLENVNDPEEGMALVNYCEKCPDDGNCGTKYFSEFIGKQIDPHIASKMFALCFTANGDRLDLWRLYANDGNGISISIPEKAFDESTRGLIRYPFFIDDTDNTSATPTQNHLLIKPDPKLTGIPLPVLYGDEGMKQACKIVKPALKEAYEVIKEIEKIESTNNTDSTKKQKLAKFKKAFKQAVQGLLLEILYTCKSEEYASEQEYRTLVFQPILKEAKIDTNPINDDKPPRVYLETKSKLFTQAGYALHIGPSVKNPRSIRLELEYRIAQKGWEKNVDIKISDIKYRQ